VAAKLSVVLHHFVFCAGLYRACCINKRLNSDAASVTPASISDISSTMSRLWLLTTGVVTLGAMALSMTLPQTQSLPFRPWVVVSGLALTGFVALNISAKRASEQAEATGSPATRDYATARIVGFKSARNMRLLYRFLWSPWISSDCHIACNERSGTSGCCRVFAFVGLLATLNSSSLRAVVAVTDKKK